MKKTNKEHLLISTALLKGNEAYLIERYGSKKRAEERLHQLEHKLNYGSLDTFGSKRKS